MNLCSRGAALLLDGTDSSPTTTSTTTTTTIACATTIPSLSARPPQRPYDAATTEAEVELGQPANISDSWMDSFKRLVGANASSSFVRRAASSAASVASHAVHSFRRTAAAPLARAGRAGGRAQPQRAGRSSTPRGGGQRRKAQGGIADSTAPRSSLIARHLTPRGETQRPLARSPAESRSR